MINQINKVTFVFEVGQKVRIKKTIREDTCYIDDLLGKEGLVKYRYASYLSNDKWYNIKINNKIEPFREYELDMRYAKKAK